MDIVCKEILKRYDKDVQNMPARSAIVIERGVTSVVIVKDKNGKVMAQNSMSCFKSFPYNGQAVRLPLTGFILRKLKQGYAVEDVGVRLFGEFYVFPRQYWSLEKAIFF